MTTSAPEQPRELGVYHRPYLYPKQEQAVFNDARYSVVEASSKSGKTHSCIAWLFEQAIVHGRPGRNYWWVSPTYPQSRIAFERLKRAAPRGFFRANESDLTLTTPNGAVIWFRTGEKPDNLYGEDVYAAVIDEATRVREESWHAIRSTLTATRGPVRIIGNVKGRKNWAYRLARDAQAGAPDMHYARITALDAVEAGVLDGAEVEDARARLPEPVFRELYMAEPSEDGYSPFLRTWFEGMRYDAADKAYSNRAIARWISWDTALKDGEHNDYSACSVVELLPDYRLVLREVWRQRMQFPALTSTIEDMAKRHNRDLKLRGVLIEDKGSGTSAYQTLVQTAPDWLSGMLTPFQPMGSKEYRAAQAGVWARNQCILIPSPSDDARWLLDFESELFDFPDAEHDDQVDSFTQAVLYLEHYIADGYRLRMEAVTNGA